MFGATLLCRSVEGFAYACAVLLAAVFVRAGAAKAARPAETAAGFRALHLPAPTVLSRIVPAGELALAALLLAAPRAGAGAALAVLAAFTAVLVRAIHSGDVAPCNCFGAVNAKPISSADVLRNGLLAGLAGGALGAPGPTVPSPEAVALVAAAGAVGLGLLRASRRRRSGDAPLR